MTDTAYVRRLTEADWQLLRTIRLNALADSLGPDDPAHRLESAFTATRWRRRLREHAHFAVFLGDHPVGLVAAQPEHADTVYLYSLWLAPTARGHKLAGRLVEAVIAWARQRDAHTVRLRVETSNAAARRLYASAGFTATQENPGSAADMPMTLTLR